MRSAVAVVVTVLAGAVAAIIAGEYPITGPSGLVGAALFGLAVAEVGCSVRRRPARALAAAMTAVAGASMVWSLWISTGHWLDPVGPWGAAAVALVVAVASWRTGLWSGGSPAGGSTAATTDQGQG